MRVSAVQSRHCIVCNSSYFFLSLVYAALDVAPGGVASLARSLPYFFLFRLRPLGTLRRQSRKGIMGHSVALCADCVCVYEHLSFFPLLPFLGCCFFTTRGREKEGQQEAVHKANTKPKKRGRGGKDNDEPTEGVREREKEGGGGGNRLLLGLVRFCTCLYAPQ